MQQLEARIKKLEKKVKELEDFNVGFIQGLEEVMRQKGIPITIKQIIDGS